MQAVRPEGSTFETLMVGVTHRRNMWRAYCYLSDSTPRHVVFHLKNIGAVGRYDRGAERTNITLAELERLALAAIGRPNKELTSYRWIKGHAEARSRLFPVDSDAPAGRGIWLKLSDWQADGEGVLERRSWRQGRMTGEFMVASMAEIVAAREREGACARASCCIWQAAKMISVIEKCR